MKNTLATMLVMMVAMAVNGILAGEEPIKFSAEPKVTAEKDGAKIEFAAGRTTDVAVEILDGKGETVRHLAAGVLGDNAPEPLKKGDLAQSLVWDRKDDLGKDVPAGNYSVRVGLGLAPRLKEVTSWNPLALGGIRGVAPAPGGGVVVAGCYWPNTIRVLALDRDGKFARQLYPPPADAPPEKSPGIRWFTRGDGRAVPLLGGNANPAIGNTRAFNCAMATAGKRLVHFPSGKNQPCMIDLESGGFLASPTNGGFTGTAKGKVFVNALALSPDGKQAYVTGIETNGYFEAKYGIKALHAVYRFPLDGSEPVKPFVGAPEESGKSETRLNEPVGLAVDKDGNLYVGDLKNDRVAVFSPEGKFLRGVEVKAPSYVQVHPASGNLYVASGGGWGYAMRCIPTAGCRLVKLSPDGKELAAAELPGKIQGIYGPNFSMALDAAAEPPVVWLGIQPGGYEAEGGLMRIEDKGTAFSDARLTRTDFSAYDPRYTFNNPNYAQYAQARQFKYLVDDGTPFYSQVPDEKGRWPDGSILTRKDDGAPKELVRPQVPFAALGGNRLTFAPVPEKTPWFPWRGMMVDRRGDIYARYGYSPDWKALRVRINHYDSDGKPAGTAEDLTGCTYGMGVDPRGNVYLGDKPRPPGVRAPEDVEKAFGGKVPKEISDQYGAVLKFGPKGGKLVWTKGAPAGTTPRTRGDLFSPVPAALDSDHYLGANYAIEAQGAEWAYVGISSLLTYYSCICAGTDLAVDPHGRVFIPDAVACRVSVLDSRGNLVKRFGGYGNMDSRGRGSRAPDPEIAFASIKMVTQASSRQVRVADTQNGWVSVISLDYEKESRVPVAVGR